MKRREYIFCVITKVSKKCFSNEVVGKIGKYWVLGELPEEKLSDKNHFLISLHPFEVGELLILDKETKREIVYPMRKPDKWGFDIDFIKTLPKKEGNHFAKEEIEFRYFKNLEKAVHFANLIYQRSLN